MCLKFLNGPRFLRCSSSFCLGFSRLGDVLTDREARPFCVDVFKLGASKVDATFEVPGFDGGAGLPTGTVA